MLCVSHVLCSLYISISYTDKQYVTKFNQFLDLLLLNFEKLALPTKKVFMAMGRSFFRILVWFKNITKLSPSICLMKYYVVIDDTPFVLLWEELYYDEAMPKDVRIHPSLGGERKVPEIGTRRE